MRNHPRTVDETVLNFLHFMSPEGKEAVQFFMPLLPPFAPISNQDIDPGLWRLCPIPLTLIRKWRTALLSDTLDVCIPRVVSQAKGACSQAGWQRVSRQGVLLSVGWTWDSATRRWFFQNSTPLANEILHYFVQRGVPVFKAGRYYLLVRIQNSGEYSPTHFDKYAYGSNVLGMVLNEVIEPEWGVKFGLSSEWNSGPHPLARVHVPDMVGRPWLLNGIMRSDKWVHWSDPVAPSSSAPRISVTLRFGPSFSTCRD